MGWMLAGTDWHVCYLPFYFNVAVGPLNQPVMEEQAKSLLTFNDEKVLFQCSYLSVHPRLLPILTSPNVGILH